MIPKGDARSDIQHCLGRFLKQQTETCDYTKTVKLYNTELTYLKQLGKQLGIVKKQSRGGLAFLAYFHGYLKVKSFWQVWLRAGLIHAAELDPDLIPTTNNFLESYNGHIKGKFFASYQHGSCLPHLDVWVLLIITIVMPCFFKELAD